MGLPRGWGFSAQVSVPCTVKSLVLSGASERVAINDLQTGYYVVRLSNGNEVVSKTLVVR